ncbi:diguanylate cyclase (GGDEF)-like protein/PAS domain S-box-containing protein [Pelomonas saccharophila]|uniref:Diguanylate cyclase (GGDEF)-like protein/PAS domain S-box-containing protein n=1 Tax=Roseateles saccharophilus TaxID=304 RepID=A0ABU1YNZ6_ROSSA|nr:EAL domain-containing protein [Roseateles saccharophilus]MDR7269945.1 diguanylate cyclase (GGDEF)-like protein/PAS domain S-box-containing protein [Roseateles saccharophilus]
MSESEQTSVPAPQWAGVAASVSAAQQALAQNARFLERCSRLAGVGAWEWQADIEKLTLSDSACELLGLPKGQVPTLAALLQRFGPDGAAMLDAALQRATTDGEGWDVELPCETGPKGRRVLRVVGRFDEDETGRRVGVVMLDVSEPAEVRAELERTLERLALATHSGGIGVWDLDLRVRDLAWDDAMWRLHGEAPHGQRTSLASWRKRLHPEDRRAAVMTVRAALRDGSQLDGEWRVCWPDGSTHVLRSSGRVLRDAGGRPLRLSGVCWDVSEARRLQRQLEEQRELLEVTLQSIADAVLTTDALGRVTWLNPVAQRLTGWSASEARGQPAGRVFTPQREETGEVLGDPVHRCLTTGRPTRLPAGAMLLSRDGELRAVDDSVAPIRDADGRVLGAVLVFRDVTQQRRQFDEIRWRASHDGLTGLVNRVEFGQRLARMLERAKRDGSRHALLAFDLDRFKLVNDHCGHAAGDEVLREVARRLEAGVRGRDTVARLGGDEFAAILENCSLDEALHVAQKLCDAMDQYRYAHGEQRFRIGTSIGVAPLDGRWPDADAAMREADACCMIAKEQGRNRVQVWAPDDATLRAHQSEHRWATRLQQALDEDRFELDLQRVMPAQGEDDGSLRGELLLRLRERDGSRVLPGAFMPAAERFHLAPRLDRWVLRQAVNLLQREGLPRVAALSINVSALTLQDAAYHQEARALLTELGPARAANLCLEITETAVITQLGEAARFIQQMRALGARIALDDFGAGASSYSYLKALPVDLLKIDGQFVRALMTDPLDQVAVRSFVDVAQTLGLTTVAECVETPEVLLELVRLGVGEVQGFLLHRPQPLNELLAAAEDAVPA